MKITKISLNFVWKFTECLVYRSMTESEIEFFDRIAPDWDANEVRSTPERIRHILSRLPISRGMKILDLGTGTGVLVPYLSELVGESGKVVGIDLSEGMLNQAIEKFGQMPNVEFLRLDFEEEQIPGMYDLVMLYSVYPHIHFPDQTMEWLFRMNLTKDGRIIIAFPSDEHFINHIHGEKKAESDMLPDAHTLAHRISAWGYRAEVLSATPDAYIVSVSKEL